MKMIPKRNVKIYIFIYIYIYIKSTNKQKNQTKRRSLLLIYSILNSILHLFWEVLWSTTQFPTKKWKFLLNMTNLGFQNHHWMIKMVPFHRWCTIQSSYWRFWPNNIIKKDLIKKYSFLPSKTMMNANLTTHFSPMFHFYTPWKRQKTKGFLTFLGGIEIEHWAKIR